MDSCSFYDNFKCKKTFSTCLPSRISYMTMQSSSLLDTAFSPSWLKSTQLTFWVFLWYILAILKLRKRLSVILMSAPKVFSHKKNWFRDYIEFKLETTFGRAMNEQHHLKHTGTVLILFEKWKYNQEMCTYNKTTWITLLHSFQFCYLPEGRSSLFALTFSVFCPPGSNGIKKDRTCGEYRKLRFFNTGSCCRILLNMIQNVKLHTKCYSFSTTFSDK